MKKYNITEYRLDNIWYLDITLINGFVFDIDLLDKVDVVEHIDHKLVINIYSGDKISSKLLLELIKLDISFIVKLPNYVSLLEVIEPSTGIYYSTIAALSLTIMALVISKPIWIIPAFICFLVGVYYRNVEVKKIINAIKKVEIKIL